MDSLQRQESGKGLFLWMGLGPLFLVLTLSLPLLLSKPCPGLPIVAAASLLLIGFFGKRGFYCSLLALACSTGYHLFFVSTGLLYLGLSPSLGLALFTCLLSYETFQEFLHGRFQIELRLQDKEVALAQQVVEREERIARYKEDVEREKAALLEEIQSLKGSLEVFRKQEWGEKIALLENRLVEADVYSRQLELQLQSAKFSEEEQKRLANAFADQVKIERKERESYIEQLENERQDRLFLEKEVERAKEIYRQQETLVQRLEEHAQLAEERACTLEQEAILSHKKEAELNHQLQRLTTSIHDLQVELDVAKAGSNSLSGELEAMQASVKSLNDELAAVQETRFHELKSSQEQVKILQDEVVALQSLQKAPPPDMSKTDHYRHLYEQLQEQFKERGDLLHRARKDLFHLQESIAVKEKEMKEGHFIHDDLSAIVEGVVSLEAELDYREAERQGLSDLITHLLKKSNS